MVDCFFTNGKALTGNRGPFVALTVLEDKPGTWKKAPYHLDGLKPELVKRTSHSYVTAP